MTMGPAVSTLSAIEALIHPPRSLKAPAPVARLWRHVMARIADPYRPELHYMRGPGPKWRAKHGLPPLPSDPPRRR